MAWLLPLTEWGVSVLFRTVLFTTGALLLAMPHAGASSINFIELPNNGGITVSGFSQSSSFSQSFAGAQAITIGDSIACGTVSCDLSMSLTFFQPSGGFAAFELKEPGGAVADIAIYRTFSGQFGGTGHAFSFIIDPSSFVLSSLSGIPILGAVTNDGSLQLVASYTLPFAVNGGTEDVFVRMQSPLETPLPAALPLFATGIGALGFLGWRRKPKAVA